MIFLFALVLATAVAPPPLVSQPPSAAVRPPPRVLPGPSIVVIDAAQLGPEARARVRSLDEALRADILPAIAASNARMEEASHNFHLVASQPAPSREALLAAASANDLARQLPVEANRRWVELALSLPAADRDLLLSALPTPSGLLNLRPHSVSAPVAATPPSPRCVPSDDVRATPTMPAVRSLMRMLDNPSPEQLAAQLAEQRALGRARAVAADPDADVQVVEHAFAELGDARAFLARQSAAAIGRLMTELPMQDRCTLLMLLPTASVP